jgi:hypothetical protein
MTRTRPAAALGSGQLLGTSCIAEADAALQVGSRLRARRGTSQSRAPRLQGTTDGAGPSAPRAAPAVPPDARASLESHQALPSDAGALRPAGLLPCAPAVLDMPRRSSALWRPHLRSSDCRINMQAARLTPQATSSWRAPCAAASPPPCRATGAATSGAPRSARLAAWAAAASRAGRAARVASRAHRRASARHRTIRRSRAQCGGGNRLGRGTATCRCTILSSSARSCCHLVHALKLASRRRARIRVLLGSSVVATLHA